MDIMAVVNRKGGVGKTTVSKVASEYFARKKRRVLAVDLDSQCNYSRRFIRMEMGEDGFIPPMHPEFSKDEDDDWSGRSSSADIYMGGEVVPYPTTYDTLDILPGDESRLARMESDKALRDAENRNVSEALRHFLRRDEVQNEYDLAIIDTGPNRGPLSLSAIRAATHLLIPAQMEPQSIEGLWSVLKLWRKENQNRIDGDALEILGILPNLFRKNVAAHEGALESLLNEPAVATHIMPMKMGMYTAIVESDFTDHLPPSVLDLTGTKCGARDEALAFCQYIEEKLS